MSTISQWTSAITATTCGICHQLVADTSDSMIEYYGDRIYTCRECSLELVECDSCCNHQDGGDLRQSIEGNYLCDNCFDDLTTCDCCGGRCENAALSDHYTSICEDCADDYISCYACDCVTSMDYACSDNDGFAFCDSCYRDNYTICDNCGEETSRDSVQSNDDGMEYCGSCYDELEPENGPNSEITIDLYRDRGCLPSRRAYAIELESSVDVDSQNFNGWRSVHDGSVAREYNSPIMSGDCQSDISEFARYIRHNGAKTDRKCGYHLHLDARDLDANEVARFASLCKRFESDVFALVPPSRRSNSFCTTIDYSVNNLDDVDGESDLAYLVYGGNARPSKYHDSRYQWININSWFYRGSIEIRLHSGTFNADKIWHWVILWQYLLEFAVNSSGIPDSFDEWLEMAGVPQATIEFYRQRKAKLSSTQEEQQAEPQDTQSVNTDLVQDYIETILDYQPSPRRYVVETFSSTGSPIGYVESAVTLGRSVCHGWRGIFDYDNACRIRDQYNATVLGCYAVVRDDQPQATSTDPVLEPAIPAIG